MHQILEIILPNDTKDIKSAISEVMEPFNENGDESSNAFWDFYTIGGRFAGSKLVDTFDNEKLDKFYSILKENEVTVSGMQCGKQEISPKEQIPFVDKAWNDLFVENDNRPCPLFNHSNNQYDEYGIICGDIMPVKECLSFNCGHLIVATKSNYDGKFQADFMLLKSIWNGVDHQDTNWDGVVGSAVEIFKSKTENYASDYKKKYENIENWLSITINYHS